MKTRYGLPDSNTPLSDLLVMKDATEARIIHQKSLPMYVQAQFSNASEARLGLINRLINEAVTIERVYPSGPMKPYYIATFNGEDECVQGHGATEDEAIESLAEWDAEINAEAERIVTNLAGHLVLLALGAYFAIVLLSQ